MRAKSSPLHVRRSCVGPKAIRPTTGRDLVEPPGTAPGSGPLITRGFIAIVLLRGHNEYRGSEVKGEEPHKPRNQGVNGFSTAHFSRARPSRPVRWPST